MRIALASLAGLAGLALLVVGVALWLVASPPPQIQEPRDVFGFAELEGAREAASAEALPALRRYRARDGAELAYRLYPSEAQRVLVFVHGSSYHGGAYHDLARDLSERGIAQVALPNLRGHHQSGRRRGDVAYIGQLEDDLRDLVAALRAQGLGGPVTLGGHSSGAGLALRFAGGAHGELASRYLLLAPIIPTSPSLRGGTAGGWASLHTRRLYGLLMLNALGIHGLDGLAIVAFSKPERTWDGTETLAYSHRLNASYHPRRDYAADIRAARRAGLRVLLGAEDEAIDPRALVEVFRASGADGSVEVLPDVDHFGVFQNEVARERIAAWLEGTPSGEREVRPRGVPPDAQEG